MKMIRFLVVVFLSAAVRGQNIEHQSADMVIIQVLQEMDSNKDGQLSMGEIFQALYTKFDPDQDQRISESEFVTIWHSKFKDVKPFAKYLFEHFDQNCDGFITATDTPQLFITFDLDRNLEVTGIEFAEYMSNLYYNCVPHWHKSGCNLPVQTTQMSCIHSNTEQKSADKVILQVLHEMDSNKDGQLVMVEVFQEFYTRFDPDQDQRISENEFVTLWHSKFKDVKPFAKYLFEHFDQNCDGFITVTDTPQLFITFDLDHDQEVTGIEFAEYLSNLYYNCVSHWHKLGCSLPV